MKPHIGSEVNLLSSYLPVRSEMMYEVNLLSSYLPVKSEMMYEVNLLSSYLPVRSEMMYQQIDLAPNVWLHSSVGRTSHRYRGGHGFESR